MKLEDLQQMLTETEVPVCMGSKLIGMSIKDIEKKFGVVVTSVRDINGKLVTVKGSDGKLKKLLINSQKKPIRK